MTFLIAYMVARQQCDCSCHWDERFCYSQMDHCLLNRIFNNVRRCTYGELIPLPEF